MNILPMQLIEIVKILCIIELLKVERVPTKTRNKQYYTQLLFLLLQQPLENRIFIWIMLNHTEEKTEVQPTCMKMNTYKIPYTKGRILRHGNIWKNTESNLPSKKLTPMIH